MAGASRSLLGLPMRRLGCPARMTQRRVCSYCATRRGVGVRSSTRRSDAVRSDTRVIDAGAKIRVPEVSDFVFGAESLLPRVRRRHDARECARRRRSLRHRVVALERSIDVNEDRRLTDSNEAWLGKVVDGRYRVLEVIGRGGMGVVYRVEHLRMGKIAAMKVLHRDLAERSRGRCAIRARGRGDLQAPPSAYRPGLRLRHRERLRST